MQRYAELRDRRDAERRDLDRQIREQQPVTWVPDLEVKVVQAGSRPKPEKPTWDAHNYDDYMQSAVWRRRKRRYFKTHARRCKICRAGVPLDDMIHLHHLSYDTMGDEPDEDLMPLCQLHHDAVHAYHRRAGGDLREATRRYVAKYGPKYPQPKKKKQPSLS